jgi:hypothetical protein
VAEPEAGSNPRATWLVKTSLYLVIMTEVFPTEADTVFIAARTRNIPLFLLIKFVFLAVILGPLFVYVRMNGWRGLKVFPGKVTAIVVIVSLVLIMNGFAIFGMLQH